MSEHTFVNNLSVFIKCMEVSKARVVILQNENLNNILIVGNYLEIEK